MKVLITGGAGFIGSHLAGGLVGRNDEVFIIDNLSTGKRSNVLGIDPLKVWVRSVADQYVVADIFGRVKPDVVVHAAASYGDPRNWREDSLTNVVGTINVVKSALVCNVKRFVYLQTSLCYGPPQERPITLSHPLNPQNSYAISKTAGERYIMLSGLDYVSLRLANCYGPRNFSGPIPTFYKRLKEGQSCQVMNARRDFVYINDLIDVVTMAVDGIGSGVYHVSSGQDYSIKDVYWGVWRVVGAVTPSPVVQPRGKDDVETILLDPSKTERDFGFVPSVKLEDGIIKTVQWYEKCGVDKTYTHLNLE